MAEVSFGTETAGSMAVSPPGDHAACDAEIARLTRHVERLGREHARHSLAVSAHKAATLSHARWKSSPRGRSGTLRSRSSTCGSALP